MGSAPWCTIGIRGTEFESSVEVSCSTLLHGRTTGPVAGLAGRCRPGATDNRICPRAPRAAIDV